VGEQARPGVLICSGLDPSGGAGFIADVRVVSELGGRPVGVVTTATVQNTSGVVGSVPLPLDTLREQLEFLLSDVEVAAVKIGLVGSAEAARAIGEALALTRAPVVWDPVARPSRGQAAFAEAAQPAILAALHPHLTLVTPNVYELALLTGVPASDGSAAVAAGMALAARLDVAVLVKAGHLATDDATDVLCRPSGPVRLEGARLTEGEGVHGTGCALASAIATLLARGADLVEACQVAKAFVAERIARPAQPGRGAPAIV
jgi:hydroxymethylpyrimidine kinase/phosphomethylpyrimidine kinase